MWEEFIKNEECKTYFSELITKIDNCQAVVFPKKEDWFNAFKLTPLSKVKVVIIGQDPYHGYGQANGLAFSVGHDCCLPPSLRNIFKSIHQEYGYLNVSGDLTDWAKQGVLLLNRILTVEENMPLSHQKYGWETFTKNAIEYLVENHDYLVFVLWGKNAQEIKSMIPDTFDIIECVHPSPLSAYRGFFDARCFTRVNECLSKRNIEQIDWRTSNEL